MDNIIIQVKANSEGISELNKQLESLRAANKKLEDQMSDTHSKEKNRHTEKIDLNTKLTHSFKELGESIVAAFTVEKLVEFGIESVKEYAKAEEAANKLKFSLINVNKEGGGALAKLMSQSEELSKTTFFSPTAIQTAQAAAAAYGLNSKQIEELIPRTANLAVLLRTDLQSALETQLKAISGQTKGLKVVGEEFVATKDKAANFGLLMKASAKDIGQAENALNSVDGTLKNISKKWEMAKEAVGGYIVRFITGSKEASEASYDNALANKKSAESAALLLTEYKNLTKDGVTPTTEQKSRLTVITEELRQKLGQSVIEVNKETGAFQLNEKAVKAAIRAKLEIVNVEKQNLASKLETDAIAVKASSDALSKEGGLIDSHKQLLIEGEKLGFQQDQMISRARIQYTLDQKSKELAGSDKNIARNTAQLSFLTTLLKNTVAMNTETEKKNKLDKENAATFTRLSLLGVHMSDLTKLWAEMHKEMASNFGDAEGKLTSLLAKIREVELTIKDVSIDIKKEHIKANADLDKDEATRTIKDKEQLALAIEKIEVTANFKSNELDKIKIRRKLETSIIEVQNETADAKEKATLIEDLKKKANMDILLLDTKYKDQKLSLESKLKDKLLEIAKQLAKEHYDIVVKGITAEEAAWQETLRHDHSMQAIRYDQQKNALTKQYNDGILSLEEYNKKLKALDLQRLKDQKAADLAADDITIKSLQERIDIATTAGEDTTQLDEALKKAQNKRDEDALRDQTNIDAKIIESAEKRADKIKEIVNTIKEVTNTALEAVNSMIENNIAVIDTQMSRQEKMIDYQKTLAEKGLANDLAFEEKRADEMVKKKLDEQKKLRKIKELETFLNSLAAFAEQDPKTALPKALGLLAATKAAEAVYAEDGGVIGQISSRSYGMNRRHSSGKDVLLHAEQGEGILSVKEMSNLGAGNFHMLKSMLKTPFMEKIIPNRVLQQDNSAVINELKSLQDIVKNKKEITYSIDDMNMFIQTEIENGIKKITTNFNPNSKRRI